MIQNFKALIKFIQDVAQDERIPSRDKKLILACVALIISPIDFIPDWIPIIGWLDDFILLALILDYFFEVLDAEILLSHFPWNMKRFVKIRRWSRLISFVTPRFLRNRLWKYESSPYKN